MSWLSGNLLKQIGWDALAISKRYMSTLEWESHWTRGMIPEILPQLYCDSLYFWNRELTKSVIGMWDRTFQVSRQDQSCFYGRQSPGASMIVTLTLNHRHHWKSGTELRAAVPIDHRVNNTYGSATEITSYCAINLSVECARAQLYDGLSNASSSAQIYHQVWQWV